jgi:hypothetical protein
VLHFAEGRPGDVNVDQAESLAGPAESSVVYHSDVFEVKPGTVLIDVEGAVRHLRGPEETRREDGGVEVVNLRARTGLEEVNSYLDESAVVAFPVRGHVFALEDPDIAGEDEMITLAIGGRARKHGYTCEAFEVGDGAGLDVESVIADGDWPREERVEHAHRGNHVPAGDGDRIGYRWIRLWRRTRREEHVDVVPVEIYGLLRRANARLGMDRI